MFVKMTSSGRGRGEVAPCLAKLCILCESLCISKVHAEFDDLRVAVESID